MASLKVAQLLRSAACLHTNQSRSYLNHLVFPSACMKIITHTVPKVVFNFFLKKRVLYMQKKMILSTESPQHLIPGC